MLLNAMWNEVLIYVRERFEMLGPCVFLFPCPCLQKIIAETFCRLPEFFLFIYLFSTSNGLGVSQEKLRSWLFWLVEGVVFFNYLLDLSLSIEIGWDRSHGLPPPPPPPLSSVWQHVKLSDASLGICPWYSLVVDEDVKKPNKSLSWQQKIFFLFWNNRRSGVAAYNGWGRAHMEKCE